MNYLIYNNELIAENDFTLSPFNRAFNYGDGLFETIIFREGKVLYLEDHLQRLSAGLKLLDIRFPSTLQETLLKHSISELSLKNHLSHNARIKLQVWRKQGGLVTPESEEADYLITATELKKNPEIKSNAFLSQNVKLFAGNLSKYKTLNFLPYILAGIEKKQRGADEIIIPNMNGYISEATTSNLFWCKDDILYTPSLETGCIDGIMRKQIIQFCNRENIKILEGFFSYKEMQQSELVFTSNVNGMSLIENLDEKKINTQYTLYQAIRIGLDLL